MVVRGYGLTDTGKKRDNNEDSIFFQDGDPVSLYAVADGMGGHAGGEVASGLAVEVVQSAFETLTEASSDEMPERLSQMIRDADAAIQKNVQEDLSRYGMGTTLTLAAVRHEVLYVAHIGDSRLYRLRDGELKQLTVDHTEVQHLVEVGHLTAEEAAESPYRHRLRQAVGLGLDLKVFTLTESIEAHDTYLLCSDGLHDMVSDEEIADLLSIDCDLETHCQNLVNAANNAGGEDNITVVLVNIASEI